jgi:hypothetical protein
MPPSLQKTNTAKNKAATAEEEVKDGDKAKDRAEEISGCS